MWSHPQALIDVFSTVCHIVRWNAHGSVSVLMQPHRDTHVNRHDEIFAYNVRPLPPCGQCSRRPTLIVSPARGDQYIPILVDMLTPSRDFCCGDMGDSYCLTAAQSNGA